MTITNTGTAGIDFDITQEDDALATGSSTHRHNVEDSIESLLLESDDIVASALGSVGTTEFEIDLNDFDDETGGDYSFSVVKDQSVDFTSIKAIVIHNKHASNELRLGSPAANSFFSFNTNSDYIGIEAGGAAMFVFSTAKTVGTDGKFSLVADAANTNFEVYVLGK
jgi:hypothetical protein